MNPQATGEQTLREDYEDHAKANGIQTEFYGVFDEDGESSVEEIEETRPEPDQRGDQSLTRLLSTIMIALLLIGVLVFLIQNAGMLHSDQQERRRTVAKKRKSDLSDDEIVERVQNYEARPDRLEAIEDMLADALAKAERDLDMIFGEADTARELEQKLRGLWHHHQPLRGLIQASEQSQFAGRPLDKVQYEDCLNAYRQIMGGRV